MGPPTGMQPVAVELLTLAMMSVLMAVVRESVPIKCPSGYVTQTCTCVLLIEFTARSPNCRSVSKNHSLIIHNTINFLCFFFFLHMLTLHMYSKQTFATAFPLSSLSMHLSVWDAFASVCMCVFDPVFPQHSLPNASGLHPAHALLEKGFV